MNDKEIKEYLKMYEKEVEKEYDDIETDKVKLPSDFKKRTLDKVFYEQADEKKIKSGKRGHINNLTKVAAAVVIIGICSFAAVKIDANIFGFSAWKATESEKNADGNLGIKYNKNNKIKENGADEAKKRRKDFPEYIPEGYKKTKKNVDKTFRYIEFAKNKKYLDYSCETILNDAEYSGIDIEGEKVSVAGYIGYIYETGGERTLQWNDDKCINTIGTDDDISDSELIKIGESMYQ